MKSQQKIRIVTLGCSKNLVDSEVLAAQAGNLNFSIIPEDSTEQEDIVILNTCGFILDAKQESIDTILSYIDKKESGLLKKVFVMGCLSERYKQDLESEIPDVDQYFGVNDLNEILKQLSPKESNLALYHRHLFTPSHYAYLKISEGCDRNCSFCAIPMIRGKHKSKQISHLVDEARLLRDKGVKELILIAQDLSYYGLDLNKQKQLPELLFQLSQISGIEWIRLHYAYPAGFPMEVLDLMREQEKICRYLDIPFQHHSDLVLENMRRGHRASDDEKLIASIRTKVPGIALRTTLLVGHPGEGENEFDELYDFVRRTRFERLGVFPYSEEEGTWGAKQFKDLLSDEEKNRRADEIMLLQQDISAEINQSRIGKSIKVLIDKEEQDYFIGRSEFDSPGVDGEVLVSKNKKLNIGDFYQVQITSSDEFDLFGHV